MLRTRLEQLSTESIQELADRHNVDIPENASREDIVELILEALEEERLEWELHNNNPVRVEEKKYRLFSGDELEDYWQDVDVELPERYNETRLVLLLRDPAWAFAYWDIRDDILAELEAAEESEQLILRVYELRGSNGTEERVRGSFDIPVKVSDRQWYVNLPNQDTIFTINLVRISDFGEDVLARSNAIRVPRGAVAFEDRRDHSDGSNSQASAGSNSQAGNSEPTSSDKILAYSGIQKLDIAAFERAFPHRVISLMDEQI